ncbi:MAG: VWA domain-containing protein, partial [Alphaproteobacteria bacterium]
MWPWAIFFAVVPVLVRLFFPSRSPIQRQMPIALRVPFFGRLSAFTDAFHTPSYVWIGVLLSVSWLAFVAALMRPVHFEGALPLPRQARNIMLAIDVSGSMNERDFDLNGRPLTRLQMVKRVAGDFIRTRTADNLGLVIFGSEAYLYAPLSFDKKTLLSLFDEVNIGIAGDQTAMGDAVVKAVQGVLAAPADSRIVILLSDGFSNAGVVDIDEAVRLAQKQQVKIYTVGIGSTQQL